MNSIAVASRICVNAHYDTLLGLVKMTDLKVQCHYLLEPMTCYLLASETVLDQDFQLEALCRSYIAPGPPSEHGAQKADSEQFCTAQFQQLTWTARYGNAQPELIFHFRIAP